MAARKPVEKPVEDECTHGYAIWNNGAVYCFACGAVLPDRG